MIDSFWLAGDFLGFSTENLGFSSVSIKLGWLVTLYIELIPGDCHRYPSWEQREIQETKCK